MQMFADLRRDWRHLWPLLGCCLALVLIGTAVFSYLAVYHVRAFGLKVIPAIPGTPGFEVQAAQEPNSELARLLALHDYLQQHQLTPESLETVNAGALMVENAASLPWILLLPATLLGAQLAVRPLRSQQTIGQEGWSRLLFLVVCLALFGMLSQLQAWLIGTLCSEGGGLGYPQVFNTPFWSGAQAFLLLPRWQVLPVLVLHGVIAAAFLALAAAAVALLFAHWLPGVILVVGLAAASPRLQWLGTIRDLLNVGAIWLWRSTPRLLLERLMLLAVGAAAAMAAVAYLFTRLSLHPRQMAAQGKTLLQRVIRSIRWRFILLFALSAGLAVVGVLITLPIMHQLHRSRLLRGLLEWLYEVAGLPLIVGYGFALFVLCFFLLTSRTTVYLEEISQVVSRIARGDWSVQVQERFHDELGDLAENINSLSRQLRLAREEEQRAEAAKNELITSVSHDLRTPMTSILGYLDLIVESEPDDSAQWQHYASIARQKAQRLQRLVDGLFEYTRLAYGGLEVQLQDISLSGLLRQLAEEFVPILQRANMQQELQLPEENVWVQADGDLLVRVFENLYSNAIRYGQSAGRMRVVLTTADGVAEVRVENYESPIPEQDLPHVFERLYRVDKSRSEQAGGAGLGLAIAKQIVELHHGQIAVESNQQVTAFIVTLPLQME